MGLLLFLLSAAVQYNDPDPVAWVALYGAAAFACGWSLRGGVRWWWPAVTGAVALAWAATIAPRVTGVPFGAMFEAFEMRDAGVEESREMYGLLLVAAWMAVVAIRAARASAKRA